MTILVLSDSHSWIDPMVQAVERTQPDEIFHLGDCYIDAIKLHRRFPEIPLVQVPGNCDCRNDLPSEQLVTLEGKRILLCHGHTYGVKSSLATAGFAAEAQSLDAFLFGHTHSALCDYRGRTLFLNPGCVGPSLSPTYAVLTVEDGQLNARIVPLND